MLGASLSCNAVILRYVPVREVLWTLLEDEEKLLLVRRLPPPLRLTRGRFEGMTARDSGGGGGATRDWYEYILRKAKRNMRDLLEISNVATNKIH